MTGERLDVYIEQAHAGAVTRTPLRAKHGQRGARRRKATSSWFLPISELTLRIWMAAEKFTLDRARYAGVPECSEVDLGWLTDALDEAVDLGRQHEDDARQQLVELTQIDELTDRVIGANAHSVS